MINAYVRMHLSDIYTRKQMVSLFDMLGFHDPEQHTKDFIKHFGATFERFRNRNGRFVKGLKLKTEFE